jgi:hypothetical protein
VEITPSLFRHEAEGLAIVQKLLPPISPDGHAGRDAKSRV